MFCHKGTGLKIKNRRRRRRRNQGAEDCWELKKNHKCQLCCLFANLMSDLDGRKHRPPAVTQYTSCAAFLKLLHYYCSTTKAQTQRSTWKKNLPKRAQHRCRLIKRLITSMCLSQPHLSGSACVMSMRGREAMGRLVGLVWVPGSSSGVSGLPLSLSFSACRHDNGGSCRLPENRLWTLHTSTPRVLPAENCPTGGSLFS